ncbi:MAG: hypothetical protein Fur0022_02360 [Anaerolineales bacterium]
MWLYLISLLGIGIFWTRHLHPVLAQEILPSPTTSPQPSPTSTPLPTPQPTSTRPPTETPLAIPDTGLIWNPDGEGVYLWQTPGENILDWLANGTVIRFLNAWEPYGGLAWAWISFDGQEGWVDATKLLRLTIPETGLSLVDGAGSYLYTQPLGQKITWLSPGTPLQVHESHSPTTVQGWVQVTLPDQQTGWLPQSLIQVIFPAQH